MALTNLKVNLILETANVVPSQKILMLYGCYSSLILFSSDVNLYQYDAMKPIY